MARNKNHFDFSKRGTVVIYMGENWVAARDCRSVPPHEPWQPAVIEDDSLISKTPGPAGPPGMDSIVPGPRGRDGVSPPPPKVHDGKDAEQIQPLGEWEHRKEYPRLALVYHENDSWICREANKGKEPGISSVWQLVAKSIRGPRGEQGLAGQRGRSLPHFLAEQSTTTAVGSTPIAAIFDSSTLKGIAVYAPSDGHADLANNNNVDQTAIGICFADVSAGQAGQFVTEGEIELEDWSAVAGGTTDLLPSATYYLSTGGQITSSPPTTIGLLVQPIGFAVSKRILSVEISTYPVLL